jgi:hypothetical protein
MHFVYNFLFHVNSFIARRKELEALARLCLVWFFISCSFIFYDLGSSVAMNSSLKLNSLLCLVLFVVIFLLHLVFRMFL